MTELYSAGLAELRLPAWRSWVRFFCGPSSGSGPVRVTAQVDRLEGELELVGVVLPSGVAEMAPEDRAWLVLDVIHAGMVRLGEARGWDRTLLEGLRDQVAAQGLEYKQVGAWKASPDRRHRARTIYRIAPDGFGRARIEVAPRGPTRVAALSAEALPNGVVARYWVNAARTLRWRDSSAVELETFRGAGDLNHANSVTMQAIGGEWLSSVVDVSATLLSLAGKGSSPGGPRLEVIAIGSGADAPEAPPRINFVGGGPTNGVPGAYLTELRSQLARFGDEDGQRWWLQAGIKELEVSYYITSEARIRISRRGNKMGAEIRRPVDQLRDSPDPRALAVIDVESLETAVMHRTGLGPHPSLPSHR